MRYTPGTRWNILGPQAQSHLARWWAWRPQQPRLLGRFCLARGILDPKVGEWLYLFPAVGCPHAPVPPLSLGLVNFCLHETRSDTGKRLSTVWTWKMTST